MSLARRVSSSSPLSFYPSLPSMPYFGPGVDRRVERLAPCAVLRAALNGTEPYPTFRSALLPRTPRSGPFDLSHSRGNTKGSLSTASLPLPRLSIVRTVQKVIEMLTNLVVTCSNVGRSMLCFYGLFQPRF